MPVHDGASRDVLDADRLAELFRLLGVANRIELLAMLRSPRTLEDIRMKPVPAQAGGRPERPISRPAMQGHIAQLVEADLVRMTSKSREGRRPANEYVLDTARLFAFVEEIRKIGELQTRVALTPTETAGAPDIPSAEWQTGPKLILVHGVREGRAFPLRHTDLSGQRGWVIGRKPSSQVRLEYDQFVSSENSEILTAGSVFRLLDLRTAKNGTWLNWSRLPVGGEAPLESGDIIGVGRSLLVFRES